MRVTVFGAGYVGLTTALGFATFGHRVVCVDKNAARVAALQARVDPLREPGIKELLASTPVDFCASDDRLHDSTAIVIAVGTPAGPTGRPDMSQVEEVSDTIAGSAAAGALVLVRSTVPVGTTDRLQRTVLKRQLVVSHPEFLREGHALADTLAPARLVAGGPASAKSVFSELYRPLLNPDPLTSSSNQGQHEVPFLWMNAQSAELSKYVANGFLATKVSFANEVANLAQRVGADPLLVLEVMALDPRIGRNHLRPSLAWGGSCFPKDTRALDILAAADGYEFVVLRAAIEQNTRQLASFADAIKRETSPGSLVAILGLAFKAETADTRESPAVALAEDLIASGRSVQAYDPWVSALPDHSSTKMRICESAHEACRGAVAVVIATEWPVFHLLDLRELRSGMNGDLFFDGRSLIDPAEATAAGFRYRGVGHRPLD